MNKRKLYYDFIVKIDGISMKVIYINNVKKEIHCQSAQGETRVIEMNTDSMSHFEITTIWLDI